MQLIHSSARLRSSWSSSWLLTPKLHVAHALRDATNTWGGARLRRGIALSGGLVAIGGLLLRLLRVGWLLRLEILRALVADGLLLLLIPSVLRSSLGLLRHAILRGSRWCLSSCGDIGTRADVESPGGVSPFLLLAMRSDFWLGGVLLVFVGLLLGLVEVALLGKLTRLTEAFLRSRHTGNGYVCLCTAPGAV